jgi:hypothetical protein
MRIPLSVGKKYEQVLGGIFPRLFAIDFRSLALFRICVGLVLLADLLTRGADIQQHYSDLGVLPRDALWQMILLSKWHWSLHSLTGSVAGQNILFACAVACAVSLVLGYRTRMAVVLSWVLLASLHARNPMLQYGGDHLLRMLLFWSMFLPLGCYWSFDRLRGVEHQGGPERHLSMASAAILLQTFMMYFFANLFKRNEIWQSGEGVSRAFSNDMFSKPLAHHLLEFPQLLEQISFAVPWFQLLLPIMLFVPWATVRFRILAIVTIAGFNLTIELLLATGIFQYVALTGLIVFLPGEFWSRVQALYKHSSPLQAATRAVNSWLLLVFPRADQPKKKPPGKQGNRVVQVLVFGLMVYVLAWNITTLKINEYARLNTMNWLSEGPDGRFVHRMSFLDYAVERKFGNFGWIGRIAKLHQYWAMFQRGGGTMNGWHVFEGTLENGQKISLLEAGMPIDSTTHRKPNPVYSLYPSARWRVYYMYLRFSSSMREFLPGVVSREWNQKHPEQTITNLRISFILESKVPGSQSPELQEFLWYEGPAE